MLYMAHAQVTDGSPYTMADIIGSSRSVDNQGSVHAWKSNLMMAAPPGSGGAICVCGADMYNTDYPNVGIVGEKIGIQVGTGTNAVTPTDNALQTKVNHGKGAGQLEYGGCECINISFSDPNGQFTLRRYFTNASGGAVTINEAGIYAISTRDGTTRTAWSFLIARDLVSPAVTVNDGEILRVTYVVQITV
jgi:hypothetical protein